MSHYTIDIDLNNVTDVNFYVFASRYLAAMDQYAKPLRNCDFTYYSYVNITEGLKSRYMDIYTANDDGSIAFPGYNEATISKDVLINGKYVFYENIPIIMDGIYLGRFNISDMPIPIKTKLIASNVNTTYKSGKYLTVKLTTANGKALKGQNVSIKIAGNVYTKKKQMMMV